MLMGRFANFPGQLSLLSVFGRLQGWNFGAYRHIALYQNHPGKYASQKSFPVLAVCKMNTP